MTLSILIVELFAINRLNDLISLIVVIRIANKNSATDADNLVSNMKFLLVFENIGVLDFATCVVKARFNGIVSYEFVFFCQS